VVCAISLTIAWRGSFVEGRVVCVWRCHQKAKSRAPFVCLCRCFLCLASLVLETSDFRLLAHEIPCVDALRYVSGTGTRLSGGAAGEREGTRRVGYHGCAGELLFVWLEIVVRGRGRRAEISEGKDWENLLKSKILFAISGGPHFSHFTSLLRTFF
jgi:hypothetical protein